MLLDLFLIGFVVTLEPIPLTAMILLLAAERGIMKGLGFTLGWLATLVGIVALTVLVTGGKPLIPQSAPSTAALTVKPRGRIGSSGSILFSIPCWRRPGAALHQAASVYRKNRSERSELLNLQAIP